MCETKRCKICQNRVDVMKQIGLSEGSEEFIELKHGNHITICGPCRWTSYKKVAQYVPRLQYQVYIDSYCKKHYPL
jgi:hypothetical protein